MKVSMKMLSALGHAYCFFRAKKRDTELASLGEQPTNLKKHRTGSVDNLLDSLSRHCTEEDTEDDQVFTAESTASESGMYIAIIVKRKKPCWKKPCWEKNHVFIFTLDSVTQESSLS